LTFTYESRSWTRRKLTEIHVYRRSAGMQTSRFSETEIVYAVKKAEMGNPTNQTVRRRPSNVMNVMRP